MKVNNNVMTYTTSKKVDAPKQPNKSEEFKKVLNNNESNSKNFSNENIQKKCNEDQNLDKTNKGNQDDDIEKTTVEGSITNDLNNVYDNNEVKAKIIDLIETSIDVLKQNTEKHSKETSPEMDQIQQLLQLFSQLFQSVGETSDTIKVGNELDSTNLESLVGGEQLIADTKSMLKNSLSEIGSLQNKTEGLMKVEQLTPSAKGMLKNNLSEIVGLLEKSKSDSVVPSQIIDVLKKLTTVQALSGNSEDKSIKDNLLQKVSELSTKTTSEDLPKSQMQSSNDSGKGSKFSGNSSSEEKFLNNLISGDKDETKISKAVSFMNQFETVKTVDIAKLQTVNTIIDKSNFGADVIKNIKFMEINNIKDLTVRMNPKELGEITIKLTMESGIMKASISAQNKDTYNLLNHNIQDISDRLKNMDIKIQSLDINIYEDSTFFNKDSNEKNNNERKNNDAGTNTVLEEEDISISDNYVIEENQVNKFV